MSKILFIYEREMPTVMATRDSFVAYTKKGVVNATICDLKHITGKLLNSVDCIVFIRPEDVMSALLARSLRRSGRLIVTFLDDDLINRDPGIPWRIRNLKRVLSLSSVLWSPSDYICKKYKDYTADKRTVKTDTVVDESQMHVSNDVINEPVSQVKIVYAAASSHFVFFDEYIKPILARLDDRYHDTISFTFVGVKPHVLNEDYSFDIRFISGMPLEEYRSYMKRENFDLGIAPLVENEFTKCKYINKYIEYSMVGVAGVYSNIIPYNKKVIDGFNGFLSDNTSKGWYEALCNAIDNDEKRKECVKNAQIDLRENHSEKKVLAELFRLIPEFSLHSELGPLKRVYGILAFRFIYYLMRPFDYLYLSMYYLKQGGIKLFGDKVLRHIGRE